MTAEFLLPKTIKLVEELKSLQRLDSNQWAKLDEVLVLAIVEQSTRQLSGRNVRRWHKAKTKKPVDRQKHEARMAVNAAIGKGLIFKPKVCEGCNKQVANKGHLHGHHEDYSKPLDVVWLCRICHSRVHSSGVASYPVNRQA